MATTVDGRRVPFGRGPRPIRAAARIALALPAVVLVTFGFAGCSQNPYLATPGGNPWQGQPITVGPEQAQLSELSRRVQLLDDNNRQLTTQLAQSEQRAQVYRDELELVRQQLADTTREFEAAKIAADNAEQRAKSFQASTQLRGGASLRPNTNLSAKAGQLKLSGISVQEDGDRLRLILPADQLFQPGTVQPLPQASSILDPVASQVRSVFPGHLLAIEAHADNAPLYGGQVASPQQLTAAQAYAVYELLTRRAGVPADQLFTIARGASRPRESNETPAGRAANRRIELVIHPESL